MKKTSLWISAAVAMVVAAALAGCGGTTYFAGRNLPPSGLTNRVIIAIQNPSALSRGLLQFVDAYYDTRGGFTGTPTSFSISGYTGALPVTIQNLPEEQTGAVYGSGDGTFQTISYSKESLGGSVSGLNGLSSSIYMSRSQQYTVAANQQSNAVTVVNSAAGGSFPLNLPGAYRVSLNPGGSVAFAFQQNTNFIYYIRALTAGQSLSYSGGSTTWPKAAQDCEPQSLPLWCLFQMQSPDQLDKYGIPYGAPLTFNRPVKAVFSADGGTAYILSCGPECGGTSTPSSGFPATAAVTPISVAPMIFLVGQASGTLPTQSAINGSTLAVPGGASNALVDTSTLYVVGQQPVVQSQGPVLYAGNLTVLDFSKTPAGVSNSISISDGAPGARSRMILADDNTLWVGMTKCTNGPRANDPSAYPSGFGCLTMVDVATPTAPAVTLLEPYLGDATGIAAITGLHKIYTAIGGQVYIYSTVDGTAIDNQYVTVTGVAADVAYMDAETDGDNTVY